VDNGGYGDDIYHTLSKAKSSTATIDMEKD
jgi:hypothetical protein